MNKAELIAKIADDAGITKTQANDSLDSFIEAVTKTLKGGGKVTLVGFGTFSVSKRAARNGRNPQTGAVIKDKKVVRGFRLQVTGFRFQVTGYREAQTQSVDCLYL